MEDLKSVEFAESKSVEQNKMNEEGTLCAICLIELTTAKTCQLHCEHFFHKACMIEWIKFNQICPLCRVKLSHPPIDPGN